MQSYRIICFDPITSFEVLISALSRQNSGGRRFGMESSEILTQVLACSGLFDPLSAFPPAFSLKYGNSLLTFKAMQFYRGQSHDRTAKSSVLDHFIVPCLIRTVPSSYIDTARGYRLTIPQGLSKVVRYGWKG